MYSGNKPALLRWFLNDVEVPSAQLVHYVEGGSEAKSALGIRFKGTYALFDADRPLVTVSIDPKGHLGCLPQLLPLPHSYARFPYEIVLKHLRVSLR